MIAPEPEKCIYCKLPLNSNEENQYHSDCFESIDSFQEEIRPRLIKEKLEKLRSFFSLYNLDEYAHLSDENLIALKVLDLRNDLWAIFAFSDVESPIKKTADLSFFSFIPDEIEVLKNLEQIVIRNELFLAKLPESLLFLPKLEAIHIVNCPLIENFGFLSQLPNLKRLSLINNKIQSLPEDLVNMLDIIEDGNHLYKIFFENSGEIEFDFLSQFEFHYMNLL